MAAAQGPADDPRSWYGAAKFGLMVHWGPYSVPAWAPRPGRVWDQPDQFRDNPYAEWYRNSLAIPGSPTAEHHGRVYGHLFPYDEFGRRFARGVAGWDPSEWAALFARSGARYVVPTAKHHDGFLLWPSRVANPHAPPGWRTDRDVLAEIAGAARGAGMRFGLYYSGGLDWAWHDVPIRSFRDFERAIPRDPAYVDYAFAHWEELIERYAPDVLWNDITMPGPRERTEALFERYRRQVPGGVINDRWRMRVVPGGGREVLVSHDFTTVEYQDVEGHTTGRWEAVRGIGNSFGYNRDEGPADYLSATALVTLLVETVARGGNLLLNLGPTADGGIPLLQRERVEHLGAWLHVNGEGIFGTSPAARPGSMSRTGRPAWFTRRDEALFVHVPGALPGEQIVIDDVHVETSSRVDLLGRGPLAAAGTPGLAVTLPRSLPSGLGVTLRVAPDWRIVEPAAGASAAAGESRTLGE